MRCLPSPRCCLVLAQTWLLFCLTLSIEARPTLSIQATANQQMRLSWDTSEGAFVLEATSSLSSPIQWQLVPAQPIIQGGIATVTITTSERTRYFRLRSSGPSVTTL